MAEERNLGTARAQGGSAGDEDSTKADLQRQMEEARESISQTVSEIKDTVTTQYQNVRESVSEALDWREQFRKRPVAWSVGALSVGFVVGYGVTAAVRGEGEPQLYYDTYDTENDEETGGSQVRANYSSAGLASGPYSSPAVRASARPSYSSGYTPPAEGEEAEGPSGPSLFERFKETQAYDRLQEELGNLGNRFVDQLSTVGTTVVLPAIFAKLKDLIGVDLSGNESAGGQRSMISSQPSSSATSSASDNRSTGEGTGRTSAAGQGAGTESRAAAASSYATSQNQSYGLEHRDSEAYSQGSTQSGRGQASGGSGGTNT